MTYLCQKIKNNIIKFTSEAPIKASDAAIKKGEKAISDVSSNVWQILHLHHVYPSEYFDKFKKKLESTQTALW